MADTTTRTDEVLLTEDGLQALKDELQNLKEVRLKEVANRLREAISYGDLSENSEYEDAKNEQAFVIGRIAELESKIQNAKIISDHKGKKSKGIIEIGSTVSIENKTEKEKENYTIVGSTEADPRNNKISNESPVGKALLGRLAGDTIKVEAPQGVVEYKIVSVE